MTDPVVLHVHIPKCAGTTVERFFKAAFGKGYWHAQKRSRKVPIDLFSAKYDPAPKAPLNEIKAVGWHFVGQSMADMFPDRKILRTIILRDPAAMNISRYNFRMVRYQADGQKPYSFGLNLKSFPPDTSAHFILERWLELPYHKLLTMSAAEKMDAIDDALARFDYVCDIKQTDEMIAWLGQQFGTSTAFDARNTFEQRKEKSGVAWTPVKLGDLSDDDRQELHRRTRMDEYVWRKWGLGEADTPRPTDVMSFASAQPARAYYEWQRHRQRGPKN